MQSILLYAILLIVGTLVAVTAVQLLWRARGMYLIHRAGPRRLRASRHVLWRDPGVVERLNLADGPGGPDGAPVAPFNFIEEHASGSQPCVSVSDAKNRRWRVKWGDEVRSENFAVRLAWACGYFAEITYYVAAGTIEGCEGLQRASVCIDADGRFVEARFELEDPSVRMLFEEHSWAWDDNPFVGTPQLHGLKILVMLLSNWDAKDRRDVARGSNTAIFEHRIAHRRREARYLITDWGGSMGRWGGTVVTRGRWDLDGFEAQTSHFVTGVTGGFVQFGYTGQRTADMAAGITVEDVGWLYRHLGRITEAQLRDGLAASGASEDEVDRFARALRDRISQLGRACGAVSSAPAA
jgi:hypothetical protein